MSDSMPPASSGAYPPAGQQPPPPGSSGAYPGPPSQSASSEPAPPGGGKPLLFGGIGVVVGLLVGVLAGSTLLGGGGAAGGGAADDAATACAYVEASVDQVSEEAMALDQPLIWQLQAAGALAKAAATGDEDYEAFGEQGIELFQAMSTFDAELAQTTLAAMEQSCDEF
ncbi:hypothetical protein [Ruania zhangjianzhongii]|uniref:hypothetical protein n=1 Tax=Ruania zhangjianzhongii TaxID=2603206 RepID=UPI0011C72014|nr:hypothetical protein [Ruania zhangjianzhongii]